MDIDKEYIKLLKETTECHLKKTNEVINLLSKALNLLKKITEDEIDYCKNIETAIKRK